MVAYLAKQYGNQSTKIFMLAKSMIELVPIIASMHCPLEKQEYQGESKYQNINTKQPHRRANYGRILRVLVLVVH